MSLLQQYLVTAVSLLLFFFCFSGTAQTAPPPLADYHLSISFDPAQGRLVGTAKITIPSGRRLKLSFQQIEITGSLLKDDNGSEYELLSPQDVLILPATDSVRTLYLSYVRSVANEFDNLISPDGISLTSNWYPVPEAPMLFTVSATLPDNFSAVTESDLFPLSRQDNIVTAVFSRPVTNIHFNAGPYQINRKRVRNDLFVYTMFFKEDQELAESYLAAAATFINRYEQEIGPYPYNHYVVVANRLPTGYGMPTFTLLGQTVLRLPFIKDTSLGHEIVHSWFGNAVQVDPAQGNWCEGLTSFLADHAYRREDGEGAADRKESITKYLSYVHPDSGLTLADFDSASHRQPMAEAKRAVGYIRGAFLFHELQYKIGEDVFAAGLRLFYRNYLDKEAGWDDLRRSFEQASGLSLTRFFNERLHRTELPALAAENVSIDHAGNHPVLSFTLVQQTEEPFSLVVPIEVEGISQSFIVDREISALSTEITVPLDQIPLGFRLDPHYDLLRHLTKEEYPAVWSRFLGAEKKLAVLATTADRGVYQPLLDSLGEKNLIVTTADAVSNKELGEYNLLFLGLDQPPSRSLFGLPDHAGKGFTLDTRTNPLNSDFVAVLVSSSTAEQTKRVAQRLTHYGKYSYLEFAEGRNLAKKIQSSADGIDYVLERLPTGGKTSNLQPFRQMMAQLDDARVIYVGENHTSLSDHRLQLRIIESLYQQDPKLVIGMEMFPTSSQKALDDYIVANIDMDERSFLRNSDYYNVWRFDFRLYRDILNFAKRNRIPVIGLNLERQIVAEVFRSGGTDSLEEGVRRSLPLDRNLDMAGYTERLSLMHSIHRQGAHGSGEESGFIQAQGLWDETMAENIAALLKRFPNHRVVVLAGAQHTRKDSGIPPRVARRVAVTQASVLNIAGDSTPGDLDKVADMFFFSGEAVLPELPKVGVVLNTETAEGSGLLEITELSPHGKAGEAGLRVGDKLIKVNGFAVNSMADLRIAMLDTKPGDIIDVTVIREQNGRKTERVLNVELTASPSTPVHP